MSDQSSSSDLRPDLDENINVTQAHGALQGDTPAASREKRLLENGMEPVSLWLILISAFVVLVGGAVVGQGGGFFAYDEVVKEGYMRAGSPLGDGPKVLPPGPALDLYMKSGKTVYAAAGCSGCHQPTGAGGAAAPPLVGSEWVTGDGTAMLSQIILHGVTGPITVAGKEYNFTGGMASMEAGVGGAKNLAALMTYLRNEWGNEGSLVSIEMAENALELAKARSGQTTAEELKSNFDKPLEGAELAPDTLVDPKTLLPVDAPAE